LILASKKSVDDGLRWAAAHGLHYVDFWLDTSPEAFVAFTVERCEAIRTRTEAAVNIAGYASYLAEATDQYL
jgi:hypothetical protein